MIPDKLDIVIFYIILFIIIMYLLFACYILNVTIHFRVCVVQLFFFFQVIVKRPTKQGRIL